MRDTTLGDSGLGRAAVYLPPDLLATPRRAAAACIPARPTTRGGWALLTALQRWRREAGASLCMDTLARNQLFESGA